MTSAAEIEQQLPSRIATYVRSVRFADGDNTPRAVVVPLLSNEVSGQIDRTVTITLSDPGGCATLGSPATTDLTIRDDDPAPPIVPVVQPYALDLTFGTNGKAWAKLAFGSRCEAMALQSNGKIVVVGGGSMFALARFNVDGWLRNRRARASASAASRPGTPAPPRATSGGRPSGR